MKTPFLVFLPLFCAGAWDLDALIEAARSAPAEFSSDALIRIAATDQIPRSRKIELLEQAFQRAAGAQHALKRVSGLLRPDGQAGYWNRVSSQELDALSLRLRAVSAMLPLDGRRAGELFLQIPPLRIPRITCEEFLVYDVRRFYEVLGDLARLASNEDIGVDAARMLERYAGAVTSPVEVGPMARLLATAPVKDGEFQKLCGSFARAMGKIAGDDRAFTYSQSAGKDIERLVEEAKRRGMSPMAVLEGYRLYLVFNHSSTRCADNDLMQGGRQSFGAFAVPRDEQLAADSVAFFNSRLRIAPLQPIGELEATPLRIQGVATGLRICQDASCRAIAEQYKKLVLNPNGLPIPPAERRSGEWQASLGALMKAIAEWKKSPGAGEAEFFQEKSSAWRELVSLAEGPAREPVMRALLAFVVQSPLRNTDRMEWFLPVNGLMGRVGLDPAGLAGFAEEARKSQNPVIALYANLDAVAPRPVESILPIL
jgi:hypothetical protein